MSQQYYDIWSFVQQILLSNSLYCSVHIVHVYMPLNICYYRSYHYCTAFIMVHLLVALPCSVRTALYATTGTGFPFLGVFPLQVLMGMLFPPPFLSLVVCEHDNPKSDGQIFMKFRQSSHYGPEITHTHTTVLRPFFRDHPGEPVPEENFWTLWCKATVTEADTPTIRLSATPSGPSIGPEISWLNFYYTFKGLC